MVKNKRFVRIRPLEGMMKKLFVVSIMILMLILGVYNIFAQDVVISTDELTITRSEDGRLFGSDGFEYVLDESNIVEYDFNSAERGCSSHSYTVGGVTYGTAQVCTNRINNASFSVYVTLTWAKPGLVNPTAFPCYVKNYTNQPLYSCASYLAQPLNVTTGSITYSPPNANNYTGAFKMQYYRRRILD